jgi:hypothetical protein
MQNKLGIWTFDYLFYASERAQGHAAYRVQTMGWLGFNIAPNHIEVRRKPNALNLTQVPSVPDSLTCSRVVACYAALRSLFPISRHIEFAI